MVIVKATKNSDWVKGCPDPLAGEEAEIEILGFEHLAGAADSLRLLSAPLDTSKGRRTILLLSPWRAYEQELGNGAEQDLGSRGRRGEWDESLGESSVIMAS